MALFLSSNIVNNSKSNFDLDTLTSINTANAETPIQIGGKNCVCKGSTCSDANWVSFRKYCGYGEGSDLSCSLVDNGRCN